MSEPSGLAHELEISVPTSGEAPPDLVIDANVGPGKWDLGEVWRDRHVLRHMVWRDLSVRYKETVVGLLWAVIQPFALMVIFVLFFTSLRGAIQAGHAPYPVTVYLGMIVWQFVSATVARGANSLLGNAHIISKVYFCRLTFPLTPLVVNLVDFAVNCLLLAALLIWYQISPSPRALVIPLLAGLMVVFAFSVSLWLSALTSVYRDIEQVVPLLLQAWFFLSPIFYEAGALVPVRWQWVYFLNPVAGIIEGLRWALLAEGSLQLRGLMISSIASIVLFVTGVLFFRRVERSVADIL